MKKVLIQHNFTSGLGDFICCVYEYYSTCYKLKKLGYEKFYLKLFLNKNVYIHNEQFWDIFNKKTFEMLFDDVEILETPIVEKEHLNFTYIYTVGTSIPGQHLWDLFLSNNFEKNDTNSISLFSYVKPDIEYIDIFNEKLIKKYENIKNELNLKNYNSIYFRTFDLQDNVESYSNFEKNFNDIFESNEKIYVSSNSYLFKQFIKKYNEKIIMYDIIGENVAGNHYNYNKVFYEDKDIIKTRTEYVIIEMLTLSDSNEINFFTLWDRPSNFLLLSLVKGTKIKKY